MQHYTEFVSNGNAKRDEAFQKLKDFMNGEGIADFYYIESDYKSEGRISGSFLGREDFGWEGKRGSAAVTWLDD